MDARSVLGAGFGPLAAAVCAAQPCGRPAPMDTGQSGLSPFGASAMAVFDLDGPGPMPARLYAVGDFDWAGAGPAPGLAAWDGAAWSPAPGAPVALEAVMAVLDDGHGPALYIAGRTGSLARFDGTAWSVVQAPSVGGAAAIVNSMAVIDPDGDGPRRPELLVGLGSWVSNAAAAYRFDGQTWTPLGPAENAQYAVVCGFDEDGPGPRPARAYAAVTRWNIDGPYMWTDSWVERYDDTLGWERISSEQSDEGVYFGLLTYDADGPGPLLPKLCLHGRFAAVGMPGARVPAANVAAWDGERWGAMGSGLNPVYGSMAVFDSGGPGQAHPLLIAAATLPTEPFPTNHALAAWDGSAWATFGGEIEGGVDSVRQFDVGGVPTLAVSGPERVEGTPVRNFAVWRQGGWETVVPRPDGSIGALAVFNDGTGRQLFAGGSFTRVGSSPAEGIARWDGQGWAPLPQGVEPSVQVPTPRVYTMAVHNDGHGWALYVAGSFARAAGLNANNIARWDGRAWSAVGFGMHGGPVWALEVHDPDGPGPLPAMLYAGGAFTTADGASARHLAVWDGSGWSEVAGGTTAEVRALRSWDDGSGPGLYVGGQVMAVNGLGPNTVQKLTASGWRAMPDAGAVTGHINAFALHDDGAGVRLYALGQFWAAGVLTGIARLDPGGWSPDTWLGNADVFAARSIGETSAPALYVASDTGLVRNRSGSWSQVSGLGYAGVHALSPAFDDGHGLALFVPAAPFSTPGGVGYMYRLSICSSCYANCDGSTVPPVLNVSDFLCFMNRFAAGDAYANCDGSTAPPVLNVSDFVCFANRYAAGCP